MIHLFLFKFDYSDIQQHTTHQWPSVKCEWEKKTKEEKKRAKECEECPHQLQYYRTARNTERESHLFFIYYSNFKHFSLANTCIHSFIHFVFVSYHIHNHFLWNHLSERKMNEPNKHIDVKRATQDETGHFFIVIVSSLRKCERNRDDEPLKCLKLKYVSVS